MATDADRRARFERGVWALAALNHANIVTMHSVEEVNGVHFSTRSVTGSSHSDADQGRSRHEVAVVREIPTRGTSG
jgi:hypothetical protein